MIPVLYKEDETNFSSFGIGALADTIFCEVTEEVNGAFECTLKYPVTGINYKEIKNDRIIKCSVNDTSSFQLFRIYRITTPLSGIIKIYSQHISYDLLTIASSIYKSSSLPINLLVNDILEKAVTSHNFTFNTDLTNTINFSIDKPTNLRAVLSGEKNSILSLYGGEFEWNNFNIILHKERGYDKGVVIEYGKNLTKLESDNSSSEVYTDLFPYATNKDDRVVTLTEKLLPILSSAKITKKTLIKDFTKSFDSGIEITEELLKEKAEEYLLSNPLGIESSNLTISFEPLWKDTQYKAVLERVSLCDIVTVKHTNLNITAKMKVIKTVYDSLAEKYISITLGAVKTNLLNTITKTENNIETINKTVDTFPNVMTKAITNISKLITGQSGGYVVLNGESETSKPYELLILDKPSIADSVNVWRWNEGGLGFSKNGYNGPYETAITSDGQIVANFITTGSLVANIIKAGVLSSKDNSSYWNLDTGEVVLRSYATSSLLDKTNEKIDEINNKKMYRLVISSSNGNIFKNGSISTTLKATVFSWDENITDTLDSNQFIWTRVTENSEEDKLWNDKHFGGTKEIVITSEDVKVKATFYCDLIDTTTRKSLLE